MEPVEKIPWWATIPLSLGWAVMGMFSPTFLPEWTQAIFYAAAMLCVAWGSVAYAWHYRFQWGKSVIAYSLITTLGVILAVVGCFLVWNGARGLNQIYSEGIEPIRPISQLYNEENQNPLTMLQIFDSDFDGLLKTFLIQRIEADGVLYSFPVTQYMDLYTSSYFMAFYVARDQPIEVLSNIIGECVGAIANNLSQVEFEVNIVGTDQIVSSKTMMFSKQVYIYYDAQLSIQQKFSIDTAFRRLGLNYQPRDETYRVFHWREFTRVPNSADDAPNKMGVQLPNVDIGSSVKLVNKFGSLPPLVALHPGGH